MEPEEFGRRQRRIEGRSGYLTRKNDPHNISMDELQNPWTLASLFMRPMKEWLHWLMDQELLHREYFYLIFYVFCKPKCHIMNIPTFSNALQCASVVITRVYLNRSLRTY